MCLKSNLPPTKCSSRGPLTHGRDCLGQGNPMISTETFPHLRSSKAWLPLKLMELAAAPRWYHLQRCEICKTMGSVRQCVMAWVRIQARSTWRPLCSVVKMKSKLQWRLQKDEDDRTKRCLRRKVACTEGNKVKGEAMCTVGNRAVIVGYLSFWLSRWFYHRPKMLELELQDLVLFLLDFNPTFVSLLLDLPPYFLFRNGNVHSLLL